MRKAYVKPERKFPQPIPEDKRVRAVYSLATHRVAEVPKEPPARSEPYRRWVASLPCAVCGIEGYSQAAHPNAGRGLGQKADDFDCFPLCATRPGHMGHHYEHDNLIGMSLDERRELEKRYTAQTRAKAVAEGVL